MRFVKQNGSAILAGLVELLIGILLFFDPVGFTSGILMAVGVILLICGVVCLIHYHCFVAGGRPGYRGHAAGIHYRFRCQRGHPYVRGKTVRALVPFEEIIHTCAGCTVSCHCGPGTLGILFYGKRR